MPIMSEEFVRQALGNFKEKLVAYQDQIDEIWMDNGKVKIGFLVSVKQVAEGKVDIEATIGVSRGKIDDKSKWSMDTKQMTLLDAVPQKGGHEDI